MYTHERVETLENTQKKPYGTKGYQNNQQNEWLRRNLLAKKEQQNKIIVIGPESKPCLT